MKFLFLGDAHIGLIVESLKNLDSKYFNEKGLIEFEFVKLSHHGSSENISKDFLDLIQTDKYIILTSGTKHAHPHKKTISDIVTHEKRNKSKDGTYMDKIEFFSNYDHRAKIFTLEEQKKYKSPFKVLSKVQKNLKYKLS